VKKSLNLEEKADLKNSYDPLNSPAQGVASTSAGQEENPKITVRDGLKLKLNVLDMNETESFEDFVSFLHDVSLKNAEVKLANGVLEVKAWMDSVEIVDEWFCVGGVRKDRLMITVIPMMDALGKYYYIAVHWDTCEENFDELRCYDDLRNVENFLFKFKLPDETIEEVVKLLRR
jgi:hypothetical protein